jgi:outer membrane autotransporter protein
MNTARSNLRTSRNGFKAKGPSEQAPLLLAYNGSDASIGQLFNPRQQEKAQAKYGLWLDGFGQWGDQDEDDGFVGFDYRMLGTALGFDYMLSDKLIAGVSVDYAYTDIDLDANQEDESIRSTGGSVYGSYFNESAYIEAILSYAKQRFDNDRHVVIGSMQRTAESDHNGDAFSTFFGGGYNFPLNNWAVGPFASLQYTYLDEESFQESGAGGLNLRIDSRETESLVSELGVRVARKLLETDCWRLIPEISAAWNYDFDIDDRDITASFAGSPGTSFTIEGQDIENSGATFSAGLRLMHKGGLMTSLEYNAEFREDYSAHGLIGEVQYQF